MINKVENTEIQSVGLTTVSVSELLALNDKIKDKEVVIATKDSEIAVLNEQIRQLKNDEKVVVIDQFGYTKRTTNLGEVEDKLNKKIEKQLGDELVDLRIESKKNASLKKELLADKEIELSKQRKDYQRELEDLQEKKARKVEELNKQLSELKTTQEEELKKIKKEVSISKENWTALIKDLQLQLEDKSEKDATEKMLQSYKDTIEILTKKFNEITSGNWFSRLISRIKLDYWGQTLLDEIRNKLNGSSYRFAPVKEVLPKFFNKYADMKVLDTKYVTTGESVYLGEDEDGYDQYDRPFNNAVWVKFAY
jgi:hypothetical protein